MDDETEAKPGWYDSKLFKGLKSVYAVGQVVVVVGAIGVGLYISQQNVNTLSSANAKRIEEKQDEMQRILNEIKAENKARFDSMVPRELYLANREAEAKQFEQIQKALDRIADQPRP